jgi:uncharacterized protein (TIGR03000 family)
MFRNTRSFCGLLLVAGAILFWSAGPSLAGHGGGGHGGGHGGGGHVGGGFRGGNVVGHLGARVVVSSSLVRPFYRTGYPGYFYPYTGYYPYANSYLYSSYYPSLAGYSAVGGGVPLMGTATLPVPVPQNERIANIQLKVPANAEVWFQGEKMALTGPLRVFQSPPLPPGSKFVYDIRARWKEDGKDVVQAQSIIVFAGADLSVQFPIPEPPPEQTQPDRPR